MSTEKSQQQASQNLKPEEGLGSRETSEQSPLAFHDTISFFRAVITPPPHPFQGVVNAEHLSKWIEHEDKLLEHEEKNEQRAFEDAGQLRKHTTGRLIIFSALFVFVIAFIGLTNPSILIQVLEGLMLFISGVSAGFGVKSYLDRKKG